MRPGRPVTARDYVEECLALSTGHMPDTAPDFGGLRALEFEFGYIVWVTCHEQAEEEGGVPEWLVPINASASRMGCTLILFDRDIERCDEFKEYEW